MGGAASLPLLDEQALCVLHDSVNGQPCTSSYAAHDLQLLLKRQTEVITKRASELEALLALRDSTNFARWQPHAKHGWGDLHIHKNPRKLAGVIVDDATGDVLKINLDDCGLRGEIPLSVCQMQSLQLLMLRGNDLTSKVDSEIRAHLAKTYRMKAQTAANLEGAGGLDSSAAVDQVSFDYRSKADFVRRVEMLNGDSVEVSAFSNWTVKRLQEQLEVLTGIPRFSQDVYVCDGPISSGLEAPLPHVRTTLNHSFVYPLTLSLSLSPPLNGQ
jgi:hypothetical protein